MAADQRIPHLLWFLNTQISVHWSCEAGINDGPLCTCGLEYGRTYIGTSTFNQCIFTELGWTYLLEITQS